MTNTEAANPRHESALSPFTSQSRDMINSDFALALVPVPARPEVCLRQSYLINTGHRPSAAMTIAVFEWRKGYMRHW